MTMTGQQSTTQNNAAIAGVQELKRSVSLLKGRLEFSGARRLLESAKQRQIAANTQDCQWIVQELALCTYKDEELHPSSRFAKALSLLEDIGLRDPANRNAETLGLGGAVYKRMWERGGQLQDAYASLNFYRAAYERDPEQDMGYGGVNAAFLLDVLASRLAKVGAHSAGTFEGSE
jgi:tetratricopeptide repeat protein